MGQPSEREFRDTLAEVSRSVRSASATALRRLGVHLGQNFLLEQLWAEDGLTTGQIARRIGVEVPTVTRMAQRMESARLVVRTRGELDRRLVQITLTALGESLRHQVPVELNAIAGQALADIDPAERRQLIDLLRRVADNLAKANR